MLWFFFSQHYDIELWYNAVPRGFRGALTGPSWCRDTPICLIFTSSSSMDKRYSYMKCWGRQIDIFYSTNQWAFEWIQFNQLYFDGIGRITIIFFDGIGRITLNEINQQIFITNHEASTSNAVIPTSRITRIFFKNRQKCGLWYEIIFL